MHRAYARHVARYVRRSYEAEGEMFRYCRNRSILGSTDDLKIKNMTYTMQFFSLHTIPITI
jgi:hypothetical protein